MLQTWMLFFCLFRVSFQRWLRDTPDSDVILLLIQISLQRWPRDALDIDAVLLLIQTSF